MAPPGATKEGGRVSLMKGRPVLTADASAKQLKAHRDTVFGLIKRHGRAVGKSCSWAELGQRKKSGLALFSMPSGYAYWFSIGEDSRIWAMEVDTGDGGVWSSEGAGLDAWVVGPDPQLEKEVRVLHQVQIELKNRYLKASRGC